jgi:peptidoglycan/LPS O-acetylase OafA/YrhL
VTHVLPGEPVAGRLEDGGAPLEDGLDVVDGEVPAAAGDATDVTTGTDDVTKHKRPDIQALRAAAVLGVLAYHLYPDLLPGGFVGVDVFFVISGFLITSHLISAPPQRTRDFARFWSRRALRLLPPVGVVVVATLAGIALWVPLPQWKGLAREAVTSMFYVQNWQLISEATNYLDAQRAPSPFQHFWSLSVEEQYYLMWPLLVGLLTYAAHRLRRSHRGVLGLGFAAVVAASFAWGVAQTSGQSAEAYFSTWTRMWELAVGSVLAAVFPALSRTLPRIADVTLLWLGLAGIAASYALIDEQTPFPGVAAALPTLATAAVILAADPVSRVNPRWLSHSSPVQLIGDCSYALYLWHWPLIVLAPYAVGRELEWYEKLVILVLSVLLAWASTNLLESPVRGSRWLKARLRRVFAMALAISVVVGGTSYALDSHVDREIAKSEAAVEKAQGNTCFGAAALDPKLKCPASAPLVTDPAFAKEDISEGVSKCLMVPPYPDQPLVCHRGDTTDPEKRIALYGNSHAGHWLDALDEIGKKEHWQIDSFVTGYCYVTLTEAATDPCSGGFRDHETPAVLAGDYDLVIMASDLSPDSSPALYTPSLRLLVDNGSNVLVIRDTPGPGDPAHLVADCVAEHLDDWSTCDGTPHRWIHGDDLAKAANRMGGPHVFTVDVNHYICTKKSCPAVVGGAIPYRDENHLTATYTKSLIPYLQPSIEKAMP